MANALECDRCKTLYRPERGAMTVYIRRCNHPYPDSTLDLCESCQATLERFVSGEDIMPPVETSNVDKKKTKLFGR